jgi:autotransporter-associated beta strand protein
MKFFKAGQGRLTISNTNSYSGNTVVSGGALFVNGSLDNSSVLVERRGTPEGPSQIGGIGRLGKGATVQAGCTVVVGNGTNSAGNLIVSNQLVELGSVLNQFDLSNDPTGTTNANDLLTVYGNLTLSGTNIIQVNQLNGVLGAGVYSLIRYSGSLAGGLGNLVLNGTFLQPVSLTNPPGEIALVTSVPGAPPLAPSKPVLPSNAPRTIRSLLQSPRPPRTSPTIPTLAFCRAPRITIASAPRTSLDSPPTRRPPVPRLRSLRRS